MARAFVAIIPPAPVLDAVAVAIEELARHVAAPGSRWTARSQWHLTLDFLGDHADLDQAAERLAEVQFAPFDMQLGGIGAFARPSRASVLWIGAALGCASLVDLAESVVAATAGSTAPATAPGRGDAQPFQPHLTVARFDPPADVRSIVHRPDRCGSDVPLDRVGPSWTVDELALVESQLGRGPARHRVHVRIGGSSLP